MTIIAPLAPVYKGDTVNSNGTAHDLPSTNGASYADFKAQAEDAKVDPPDVLSAQKVQEFIKSASGSQGNARQAFMDALRAMIGYMPADERAKLLLFSLFDPPNQKDQVDRFLDSCTPPPGAPRFQPLTVEEVLKRPSKVWLVDQFIGAGDLATLYGPPGSGKTFTALDLLFAACLGRQFARRFDVPRPITVAYCAGEGMGGLPARIAAAAEYYGVDTLPNLSIFEAAPQLFDESSEDTIVRFIADWQHWQTAGQVEALDLLVIDTLHSATYGAEENSAQDMGKVLRMAKAATKALGCAVLLLHHSNKAGTAERGSSALRGAMDTLIEIKPAAGKFILHCEKLKDGAAWKDQTFDLVAMGDSVRVWWDELGEDLPDSNGALGSKLLAELRNRPGIRFGANQLAEAVGSTQRPVLNALRRLVDKGEIKRTTQYEGRDASNRNPWVYYVESIGSTD